jgi:RNA exonuclease 1
MTDGAKYWTCCNRHSSQPGCKEAEDHEPVATTMPYLRARFQHVPTYEAPIKAVAPHRRVAVAIDCEMGTSKDHEPEVIRLTLIDYFTSEVLIDSLVWPDVPMLHYNTRYSGVSRPQLNEARRTGKCIMGLDRAREMVWKYVDNNTYVIGHSLSSDLTCMRWLHHNVVDSYVLEHDIWKAAVGELQGENRVLFNAFEKLKLEKKEAGESVESLEKPELKPLPKAVLSLKDVTKRRFGRTVQEGKAGHDSLEDALSARNLVDWHVRQSMEREESKENLIMF